MQKQDSSQSNSVYRFILLLLFVIFAFLLLFLYQIRRKTPEQKNSIFEVLPTPIILKMGAISLRPVSDSALNSVNKEIELYIEAGSESRNIVGYDVIVKFVPGELEIVSAESQLPDFDLFPIRKSDHLILTGTKKLNSQEPSVWENTPILLLKVKAKKTGNISISLAEKLGLEKSQLFDAETKILSPEVGSIILEIK